MNDLYQPFFVEDSLGHRYEYNSDTYEQPGKFSWEFGVKAKTVDEDDITIVIITRHELGRDKDEFEIVKKFLYPVSVGNMKEESYYRMEHLDIKTQKFPFRRK